MDLRLSVSVWVFAPEAQPPVVDGVVAGEALHHVEHFGVVRDAFGDGAVAISAIRLVEEPQGNDRPPEGFVAHGLQPFAQIINSLKASHANSISNPIAIQQICVDVS